MYIFLRLAKEVISGEALLNGGYPVSEALGLYGFEAGVSNLRWVLG